MDYSQSYIRSICLIGFKELLRNYDVDAEELVKELGLDPRILTNSNLVYPYQSHVDLWELAAQRCGEPNLGLQYALFSSPTFPSLGPIFLLTRFEKTVGGWFESTVRHLKYHSNAIQVTKVSNKKTNDITFRLSTDPYVQKGRQVSEADAALILLMLRKVLLPDIFKIKTVRFPHPEPQNTELHSQIFQSELEFGSIFLEAVVDKDVLSKPFNSAMSVARPVVNWFVTKLINSGSTSKSSLSHQTRMAISLHLGTKRLNLNDIAETLGKHPKNLQRSLISEGTNYSLILEKVREEVACSLLENSKISISTIAGYLDYSNSTAFLLAFKRWKNITPTQYRKKFQSIL